MKKLILTNVLLAFIISSISAQKIEIKDSLYNSVLSKLKNNFTLLLENNEMEEKYYFESYQISKEDHKNLHNLYLSSIQELLEFDKEFANHLLTYKKKKRIDRSSWIKTVNPNRSDIYAYYSRGEEVLILIDFFLIGESIKIDAPSYLNKISFKKIKKFLSKNKSITKEDLRKKYKKWLACEIN